MANDRVEVKYGVSGVDESAAKIERLNKAISGTSSVSAHINDFNRLLGGPSAADSVAESIADIGTSAEKSAASMVDLNAGVSGLSAVVGQVNPLLGSYINIMASAKFASDGFAAGASNIGAAFTSLVGVLANPIFLSIAAVFGGIALAVKSATDKEASFNEELRKGIDLVKQRQQAEAELKSARQKTSTDTITTIEAALSQKGLPASQARQVAETALRASSTAIVSPQAAIAETVRRIRETGQIPSEEDVIGGVATRDLGTISGIDLANLNTRQLDRISRTRAVQQARARRALSLQGSESERVFAGQAGEISDSLFATSAEGIAQDEAVRRAGIATQQLPFVERELEKAKEEARAARGAARAAFNPDFERVRQAETEQRRLEAYQQTLTDTIGAANDSLRGNTVVNNFYGTTYLGNGGDLGVSPNRVRN